MRSPKLYLGTVAYKISYLYENYLYQFATIYASGNVIPRSMFFKLHKYPAPAMLQSQSSGQEAAESEHAFFFIWSQSMVFCTMTMSRRTA